jgi:uncharacterized protein (TIGR02246 family)
MRLKLHAALLALLLTFALPVYIAAQTSAQKPSASTDTIRAARAWIDKGNARWIEAQKRADAALLAAQFAEDGTQFAPNGVVIKGRAAIEQSTSERMKRIGAATDYTINTAEVWLVDDLAYETGKATYKFQPKDKPVIEGTTKYVTVWKRQPNNSWKIVTDFGIPE